MTSAVMEDQGENKLGTQLADYLWRFQAIFKDGEMK